MVRDEFGVLAAFVAVAEERSFTRAAKRLGVSPSALSHAIRGLEERIGVRLLARTTRSVAPTEAGEQLFARVRPAFGDIHQALDQVAGFRERPAGRVRLLLPRSAAMIALVPKLAQLARDYPDVVLDVTTDNSRVDLVAAGFDAGIEIGEFIQKDMVAVRVSEDLRAAYTDGSSKRAGNRSPWRSTARCSSTMRRSRCERLSTESAWSGRWSTTQHRSSPLAGWCGCSRTGVRRSQATFSTTRADDNNRPRFQR
jgi:DNA-binding transcriptional LysR family regulator